MPTTLFPGSKSVVHAGLSLLCLATLCVLPGCGGGSETNTRVVPITRAGMDAVLRTDQTGYRESTRQVVRDRETWEQVWSTLVRNMVPPPPVPEVDFSREMLVVTTMGTRSTGGYSIRVENVIAETNRMVATVRKSEPNSNCVVTDALTAPADVVRMTRSDMPVVFEERDEVAGCQ